MTTFNRRAVLMTSGLALVHGSLSLARGEAPGAGVPAGHDPAATPHSPAAAPQPPALAANVPLSFPSTDPELVGGVVGAAHTDLDAVVEMVSARPHLARATVDWGFGDWESALGAASHMGRRDIAEFLIDNGARPDIFSAAMLGQLEVVRALVAASPGVQRIPGPHGITLLAHAHSGGEAAVSVLSYLEALGDADIRAETVELSDEQRQPFVGIYGFDAASNATLEIADNRGALSLRRDGRPFGRRLFPLSETEFYPSGSPTVRIVFDVEDGQVRALRVIDNTVLLAATKVAG